jgi:hypothetical protein
MMTEDANNPRLKLSAQAQHVIPLEVVALEGLPEFLARYGISVEMRGAKVLMPTSESVARSFDGLPESVKTAMLKRFPS